MNHLKRLGTIALAVVTVLGIGFLTWDYHLTASENDGSTTAAQQQQTAQETAALVEVVIPTKAPTEAPTAAPTEAPTAAPTEAPTAVPTEAPTAAPTEIPAPVVQADPVPATETTEAPTAEPAAEPTAEPTTEPTAEPTAEPTPLPEITLEARLTTKGQLYLGDEVELEAIVEGVDAIEYTLQWQYNDGSGWKDIHGETDLTYRFELTEANVEYSYRVAITSDAIA